MDSLSISTGRRTNYTPRHLRSQSAVPDVYEDVLLQRSLSTVRSKVGSVFEDGNLAVSRSRRLDDRLLSSIDQKIADSTSDLAPRRSILRKTTSTYSTNRLGSVPPLQLSLAPSTSRAEQILNRTEMTTSVPSAEAFSYMKTTLRDLNNKMLVHRMLLDRYTKMDTLPPPDVSYMVDDKYYELVDRMPELEGYRVRKPVATESFTYSPIKSPVVLQKDGLVPNQEMSNTRRKIRGVICKTRNDPSYYQ